MKVSLLQQWVTQQSEAFPERVAIVFRHERVTYGQLEQASNSLARLLKDAGCRKGDRICFLIPKSPAALVSMLGILKADCMHVPLDPSSPAPRLARIVQACRPRAILAGGRVKALLNEVLATAQGIAKPFVGWMESDAMAGQEVVANFSWCDLQSYASHPLDYRNTIEDPAHILFTSGSTGNPKGVVITHSNVIHFIRWAVKYFQASPTDKISSHPPLHFDLSTFDVFGTFSVGAELHLVPMEFNLLPHKLSEFIRSSELTQWFSVPSLLTYMAKLDVVKANDFPTLKRLLWCGEVFPTPALMYWMKRLPTVQFTNLYGPTEATIASSYYTVSQYPEDERAAVPIGTACDGEELLVLGDGLKPLPLGEIGDLYIGGVGLSPGYWENQEQTDAVFLRDPRSSDPSARIYKTGDLGKVGKDGLVYFIGRVDSQIKSRGYRIELGEIETALNALHLTEACAVVAVKTDGFEGHVICCAYVLPKGSDLTPASLRSELGKTVPPYMLPARWVVLDQMPLNVNGKYDRKKLKDLFTETTSMPGTSLD
ncbi:MAG: D-alanine--poly(phosphoribitol) ligase [Nitrospira sp. SG-bin1]|nr:MAG: D-alanine--poly(phosphoribitol) ligase [Nitrospira sp. SG-bin1]